MNISIFILPPFLTGLFALILGLFVLLKNRSSALNRILSLICFCLMLWQFGNVVSWSAKNGHLCRLAQQILYVGVAFISAAIYHFSVEFNDLQKQKNKVPLVYFFSTLLTLLVLRSDFIIGHRQVPWGKHIIVGRSHTIFLLFWILPIIFALLNFYYGYKRAPSPFERRRRRFAFLCCAIGFLSTIDYIPNYGVPFPYPLGFIFLIFFLATITYAIIQYRLVDIKIILKKVSIITFLCTIAAICIYIAPFYMRSYLYSFWGKNWIFFPISIAFLFGLGLLRLIYFIKRAEEVELSKKFAYRPILKKEAERASAARNLSEFLIYLTRDVSSWVRLDYIGVMVWNKHAKEFTLLSSHTRSRKREKIPKGLTLSMDNPLVIELLRRKNPVVFSELKYYLDTKRVRLEDQAFTIDVLTHMQRLGTEIAIPCFCEGKLLAVVNTGHKLDINDIITSNDLELFSSLSNNIARTIHDFMLKQEKIQLIVASQHILITAIEAKDRYTRGHTDRVANYSTLIGMKLEKRLRLYHQGLQNLNWAAQLHDLGKLGIPDSILLKNGPLNEEEWRVIKRHTIDAVKIIDPMREWLGKDIYAGVLYHHENIDGSGYPAGQKGNDIHLFARIIRVADAYDAMTTDRPYRPALTKEQAIDELKKYQGIYFDNRIVNIMIGLYNSGEV